MIKRNIIKCFIAASILISGCSYKVVQRQPKKPPLHVAVLPMSNESNDAGSPEVIRKMFSTAVKKEGYVVLDQDTVDAKLKEMGITDGGQLNYMSQKDISAKLGVDILIYGNVIEFFQGTTFELLPPGLVYKREVKASFKMVDVPAGKIIWEREETVLQKDPLDKKGKKNDNGLLGNLFTNVVSDSIVSGVELLSKELVQRMAEHMPSPFYY